MLGKKAETSALVWRKNKLSPWTRQNVRIIKSSHRRGAVTKGRTRLETEGPSEPSRKRRRAFC